MQDRCSQDEELLADAWQRPRACRQMPGHRRRVQHRPEVDRGRALERAGQTAVGENTLAAGEADVELDGAGSLEAIADGVVPTGGARDLGELEEARPAHRPNAAWLPGNRRVDRVDSRVLQERCERE